MSFQAWYAAPDYKETDNEIEIDTKTQTVKDGWNQWDILATPEVETVIPISSGAYIISVGGKNYKVSF